MLQVILLIYFSSFPEGDVVLLLLSSDTHLIPDTKLERHEVDHGF